MYPRITAALAGWFIFFISACTTTHTAMPSSDVTVTSNRQSVTGTILPFIGPPEYIPVTASKASHAPAPAIKVVERGGRYTYVPPAFTMARPEKGTEKFSALTLLLKAAKIKKFAAENKYDTAIAFFIDMQVKSGKNRFFVVDLSTSTIVKKGLVAHGKGNEKFTFDRHFSNGEGSNCTSLGIYRIGKAYTGAFGLSYKLYGLNKTNNNALKRFVVLHAMGSIPYNESKWPVTQTEGCPAVAPAFLEELSHILDDAPHPVLLYIYNGDAS